jgi:hypothetical protein
VAELSEERHREAEKRVKDETELFPEILAEARKMIPGFDALPLEEKLTKYLEIEPKLLFQSGLHQHHTIGNIDAAVQRYKRVIKRFPNEQEAGYARKQLNRISAASKADPVQEKMAPIFTLLGFETSTEDPGKWIAKERTGSGVKPDESRVVRSDAEIKTSEPQAFHQQPSEAVSISESTRQDNIEKQKTSGTPKILLWKPILIAAFITMIITLFLLAANPEKKRINIGWTFMWILLTVEGWKYWKWKSLIPYPAFILCGLLAYPIVAAAGGDLSDARLLLGALNIVGLIIFSIIHYRRFKKTKLNMDISGKQQGLEAERHHNA